MRPLRTVLAAIVVTAVTAGGLIGGPAVAGDDDEAGDVRSSNDIVRVDVAYGSRLVVEVHHRRLNDDAEHLYVFIDTNRRRYGPNHVASVRYSEPTDPFLSGVNSWRTGPGTHDRNQCRFDASSVTGDVTRLAIPSRCIGDPDKIRVAAVIRYDIAGDRQASDWAPGFRTFGPTILR